MGCASGRTDGAYTIYGDWQRLKVRENLAAMIIEDKLRMSEMTYDVYFLTFMRHSPAVFIAVTEL
jgi:hypothetical protein